MKGAKDRLRRCRGVMFDLDGTIYLGDGLLPGAAEVVARLRETGRRVLFVSNKPIASRESYAEKLRRLGVPCEAGDVLNSLLVLVSYQGCGSRACYVSRTGA